MIEPIKPLPDFVAYHFPSDKQSTTFSLQVNGIPVPVTEFPNLEAQDYERIAAAYREMPSYCWVEARFVGVHYAHLAGSGPFEVTIGAPEEIRRFSISPKRKGIGGQVNGLELHFRVEEASPAYLIVDINDLPLLCLLIDPPEQEVPSMDDETVVDASRFLTDASGKTDQTVAFRKAIRAVQGTGKTLVIPAGIYLTGTIRIHRAQNFKIYFTPGCLIRTKISPPGANRHSHGIWIDRSRNITLFGPGVVDHQAYENFKGGRNNYGDGLISWAVSNPACPYTTMSPLCITRSRDIHIERLTVRNSRNFNYNVRRSEHVTFRYCKAITPPACIPEYTDGFNINSCQGFLLEDCFVFVNDDCFAAGHYFDTYDDRESKDYIIRGLVGWNPRANGVRLGILTYYDMGDLTFENCDFMGPDYCGLIIHPLKDAPEAGRIQRYGTIRFENCGFDYADRLEFGLILVDKPRIRRLELIDLTFDRPAPRPSRLEGHPDDPIGELLVRRLRIGGEPCTDLARAGIEVKNVAKVTVEA